MRFSSAASVVLAFVLLSLPLFTFTRVNTRVYTAPTNTSTNLLSNLTNPFTPVSASALASDNLNFQARLASASGAIVADGYYNVQFKLYSASTGGTALWTETHAYNSGAGTCSGPVGTNDCRIRVVNGYVSVYLGSVTSFPNTIPWDQQLYLTMNVGGTTSAGAITYDGEMTPRLKLTAVPYAMEAKKASQLTTSNGALISNLSITAPTVGNQNFVIQDQGAAGTYNVLLEETAATVLGDDFIQNQNAADQTASFRITGTAQANTSLLTPLIDTATATALNIGTTNATSINLNQNTVLAAGKSITITGGNTASRPASPTEGMLYYDTTTKQLLQYNGTKWVSDRTDAVLVAASDSSQADKDAADYVADGTDDQVQINAALSAADPASGTRKTGKVYLFAGTYTTHRTASGDASIKVPNSTTLAGTGEGTVIKLGDIDVSDNLIENNDTATGTGITIRDMKLDGQKSLNTAGYASAIYLDHMGSGSGASATIGATVTNVHAYNFTSNAITLISSNNNTLRNNVGQGSDDGRGIDLNSSSFNVIEGNVLRDNYQDGIYLDTSANNVVTNNILDYNHNSGVFLWGSAGNTITSNIAQGNWSYGIFIQASSNNTVSTNTVSGNVNQGIYLRTANNNTVVGNKLHDNGAATNNDAIQLNFADGNTITGNDISDTSATTNNYAINITDAASDKNYLADNRFSSTPGTSTIRDLGTGTVFANQPMAENGMNLLNRSLNSTTAFTIQGTNKVNVLNVDTTNGEIELGAPTLAGKLVLSDGSSNTVTISVAALAGDYTLGIPTMTSNDTLCLVTAANCANGTMFIQNQNAAQQASSNFWISGAARADTSVLSPRFDTATAVALNIGTVNAASVTIGSASNDVNLASDTVIIGNATSAIIQGAPQGVGTNGIDLTVRGGNGGPGGADGGDLIISGGDGSGAGAQGLVSISTTAFSTSGIVNFGTNGTINSFLANAVNLYSSVRAQSTTTGLTLTVDAPTNTTTGRLLYLSNVGTNDFNIMLSGTGIIIALKYNSTATLIWNGNGWTAAGASSSTDLQSAYNNTLTSAGGAELVLNASGGAADGLTIRNNSTAPISGGILEIQSTIGTNLFSVNNYGTELAANGGAETSTTFATNWTAAPAGGTVSRNVTAGQYVTGQAGAQVVTTTTANTGIRNNLSGNPVNTIGAEYQVSFSAKSSLSGTTIDAAYSRDGGTALTACTDYGTGVAYATLSNTVWTKVTCTITIDSATAVTNPDLIIRKTDGSTAPTIYIDNLSFIRNDTTTQPSNVQIGGGITGGQVTLFTLDRSSAPPVANGDSTYYGSMYYDTTTGRIQCYESDGWGACGSAPDNIVILTPEYSNAVLAAPGTLGGTPTATGVGTMTADFCSNQSGVLQVNTGFCASGLSRNYYRWTSPQASAQTYSIYVSYKLPSTFKQFYDTDTVKLTALKDHATNAGAALSVFKSTGGAVAQCGSTTTITTSTNSWVSTSLTGDETACNFAGGDTILFKIDVTAQSNASVYVENLEFRYTNV